MSRIDNDYSDDGSVFDIDQAMNNGDVHTWNNRITLTNNFDISGTESSDKFRIFNNNNQVVCRIDNRLNANDLIMELNNYGRNNAYIRINRGAEVLDLGLDSLNRFSTNRTFIGNGVSTDLGVVNVPWINGFINNVISDQIIARGVLRPEKLQVQDNSNRNIFSINNDPNNETVATFDNYGASNCQIRLRRNANTLNIGINSNNEMYINRRLVPSIAAITIGSFTNPWTEGIFGRLFLDQSTSLQKISIGSSVTNYDIFRVSNDSNDPIAMRVGSYNNTPTIRLSRYTTSPNSVVNADISLDSTGQLIFDNNIIPSTTNTYGFGTSTNRWESCFLRTIDIERNQTSTSDTNRVMRIANTSGNVSIVFTATTQSRTLTLGSGGNFLLSGGNHPLTTNSVDLGATSNRWRDCYLVNNPNVSSDVNDKKDIENSDLGLDFINELRPVKYRLKDNQSNRYHYGLIAQEVRDTLIDNNYNPNDTAFYCQEELKDVNGNIINDENNEPIIKHSLRYGEFSSVMMKAIQELSTKVNDLENRLNQLENN